MKEVLNLYKKPGETPLECLERFRVANPEYNNISMTYAGRLDPLASGVLVVLAGDSVYKKDEFLGLNKKYEVEVLFGFETDTFDVLGVLEKNKTLEKSICSRKAWSFSVLRKSFRRNRSEEPQGDGAVFESGFIFSDKKIAENKLLEFIGKNIFEYPPYSSKTINGKPLFAIARAGELDEVELPKKEIEIHGIHFIEWKEASPDKLLADIENSIKKVKGDFRQGICLEKWRQVLVKPEQKFNIAKIEVEASSGAYMRTLAHEWGKKLGIPALAYKIVRTRLGDFDINESLKF